MLYCSNLLLSRHTPLRRLPSWSQEGMANTWYERQYSSHPPSQPTADIANSSWWPFLRSPNVPPNAPKHSTSSIVICQLSSKGGRQRVFAIGKSMTVGRIQVSRDGYFPLHGGAPIQAATPIAILPQGLMTKVSKQGLITEISSQVVLRWWLHLREVNWTYCELIIFS